MTEPINDCNCREGEIRSDGCCVRTNLHMHDCEYVSRRNEIVNEIVGQETRLIREAQADAGTLKVHRGKAYVNLKGATWNVNPAGFFAEVNRLYDQRFRTQK